MKEKTYAPLRFAKQFNLESVKGIVLEGARRFGALPGTVHPILEREIREADTKGIMEMVYRKTFLSGQYDGPYPVFHRFLMESRTMNNLLFEGANPKEEWRDMLGMSAVVETWRQHKQVYLFDPEFVSALSKTDKLKVYPSLLRHLPYHCFYLDFSNIDEFRPFDGMFVYVDVREDDSVMILGHRVMGEIYYTCKTILGKKEQAIENGIVYYDYERSKLAFSKEVPLSESCRKYSGIGNMVITNERFPDIWMFLMQALTYLSSKEPDVQEDPKQKTVYRPVAGKVKDKHSEIRKWDVGIRYGTRIRIMKEESEKEVQDETEVPIAGKRGSRKPMRPHSRCAHWAHYWTGPGRKQLELRWIEPVFIGPKTDTPVVKHIVNEK